MPETDTNTVTPGYLNITTGAITDGDAWVNICSAKITTDAGLADVTFQSSTGKNDWSQYQDLVLLGHARATLTSGNTNQLHYNYNDSTSGYKFQLLDKSNTGTSSVNVRGYAEYAGSRGEASVQLANSNTSFNPTYTFSPILSWFPDINSGTHKLCWTQCGTAGVSTTTGGESLCNVLWESTDAIEKLKIWTSGTNLADHSRFELYGILPRLVAP
jgi:hypothetical protein